MYSSWRLLSLLSGYQRMLELRAPLAISVEEFNAHEVDKAAALRVICRPQQSRLLLLLMQQRIMTSSIHDGFSCEMGVQHPGM